MSRNRTRERHSFDQITRTALLESDMDEIDEKFDQVSKTLTKILWMVVGVVISMATSAILFAANLAVK